MEHLDLIILGGFYGEGRRGGLVSQFLLGVAKPPAVAGKNLFMKLWRRIIFYLGGNPTEFYSFSRVGSGYSKGELTDTLNRLKDLWQDDRPPNVFVSKEKPDVWILPEKSLIAEVYILNNIIVQNKTILSLLSGESQWDYSKFCLHSKFHAEVSKSAKVSAQFDVEWLLERRPADRSEKSKISILY